MSISLLLEMAMSGFDGREAVVDGPTRLSAERLSVLADGGAGLIQAFGAEHVAYVGTGGWTLPLLLFSSARAGLPVTPLNYRLSADSLSELVDRLPAPLVVVDSEYAEIFASTGRRVITTEEFIDQAAATSVDATHFPDGDDVAVVLFTSGTTSTPKAVELTHNNLMSYITGTVEFGSADPDDAALICVPPYHIAGVGAALSNLYAGRRAVYLRQFDARAWIDLVVGEKITTATVVPTMLDRIVSALREQPTSLPSLRNLAYGGSKVPMPLVRAALELLPGVGFVNAYGLTETSSTISVLTPDDHLEALSSADPVIERRLASVGRPVPGIEIEVRSPDGERLETDEVGELFIRGEQVSGRYRDIGSVLDADGWFPTKDLAAIDEHGYLYLGGRTDDTIIRGGENIAPAEIEAVLVEHPEVGDVAVVGVQDAQWGQIIVAVVVPEPGELPAAEELRSFVRDNLRGSRTPDAVIFRNELPTSATGKVLRRTLVAEMESEPDVLGRGSEIERIATS